MIRNVLRWVALAFLLLCTLSPRAQADVAIVIGNDAYPFLNTGNLDGCVNDANAMEATLTNYGFRVIKLLNDQATKKHIRDTLARVGRQIKPNERFVFYFAGHGSKTPDDSTVLLAHDAREGDFANTLGKADLDGLLAAIKARGITVLLDACFSEGALRSKGLTKLHKLRFHPMGPKPKRLTPVNQTDTNNNLVNEAFCAFASSTRLQSSGETKLEGQERGVFTYFLEQCLKAGRKTDRWAEIVSQVTSKVAEKMDGTQTPVFGPADYADVPVFEGRHGPKPPPKPHPDRSLWDRYVENRAKPAFLTLNIHPNQSQIKRGTEFEVQITTGPMADGYLVLLNTDASDTVYLFSPDPDKITEIAALVRAAHIAAGTTRTIPCKGEDLGMERLKAILFRTEAESRALLEKFPRKGAQMKQLRSVIVREVEPDAGSSWDYVTAMAEVEIVEKLPIEE